jgi:hypothetical protein
VITCGDIGDHMMKAAALVLGAILVLVQLHGITDLVSPLYAEGLGYDLVWVVVMSTGLYMLLFGLGVVGKRKPR